MNRGALAPGVCSLSEQHDAVEASDLCSYDLNSSAASPLPANGKRGTFHCHSPALSRRRKISPPRLRCHAGSCPRSHHTLRIHGQSDSTHQRGYSHAARQQSAGEIWHTGHHEHRIRDLADFQAQKHYIANNPIRKGYSNYPHVHTAHSAPLDTPLHLIEQVCS